MPSVWHFASTAARASSLDVALFFDSTCAISLPPSSFGRPNEKRPGRGDDPRPRRHRLRIEKAYRSRLPYVNAELEAAEFAAYTDAFRSAPEVCEVAEISGATCLALRKAPERTF